MSYPSKCPGLGERLRACLVYVFERQQAGLPTERARERLRELEVLRDRCFDPVYFGRFPWESRADWCFREAQEYRRARELRAQTCGRSRAPA